MQHLILDFKLRDLHLLVGKIEHIVRHLFNRKLLALIQMNLTATIELFFYIVYQLNFIKIIAASSPKIGLWSLSILPAAIILYNRILLQSVVLPLVVFVSSLCELFQCRGAHDVLKRLRHHMNIIY